MNDPELLRLRELSWRRKLTEAEQAELRKLLEAHPEARADWELDAALGRLLEQLPEAPPVASNFTALVMQAAAREEAACARAAARSGWRLFPVWIRRTAAACVLVGVGLLAWREHEIKGREVMAQRVAGMVEAVSASGPEVIENFDPIYRLGETPPQADTKLIALLQ